jgi:aryl-alcohol dehydrogenase-like predicted oxidoreductase
MDYRPLGSTGLEVSSLGLGTAQIGLRYGADPVEPPAAAESIRLLRRAAELGINYFDTAPAYGDIEPLVGEALEPIRPRPVIGTKLNICDKDGPFTGDDLRNRMSESVDGSLRKLRIECIDLLQIHSAPSPFVTDELLAVMDELSSSGKVLHWGATTYGEEPPLEALTAGGRFRTVQIAYSLLDRTLERRVIPRLHEEGVGLILRSMFLQGALSPVWTKLPEKLQDLRGACSKVADVAQQMGVPMSELALRYAAFQPRPAVAVFGTISIDEIDSNVAVVEAGPLPDDVIETLNAITLEDESQLNPGTWGHLD